jgi:UDP-N-acetylmuramoyl-L-alanyl-D-glutamate--2,6-diaminopimelate ligase
MLLKDLLAEIYPSPLPIQFAEYHINHIYIDSRQTQPNGLFVACKGSNLDGTKFIDMAIDKGAMAVVVPSGTQIINPREKVCYLEVNDTNLFLRKLAKRFFDDPSQQIRVVGITGTNGKTTVSNLVESIISSAGRTSGLIGTIHYRIGRKIIPSNNTTPGFLDMQKLLDEMVSEGMDYCVMEVSSHGLVQRRVDMIDFKAAVFTNLTSDHLDYHKTRDNYFQAKALLFTELSPQSAAIINVDDTYGRKLISMTSGKVITYGIENTADIMAKDVQLSISGTQFKLVTPQEQISVRTKLVGLFNVYNILSAVGVGVAEGLGLGVIKEGIERLSNVPGRLEKIDCGQDFTVIVDYAHTQDALENVLKTIRVTSDSKIILVFGCGGDRDKTKRPAMGKVAGRLADFSIVTSDNSRSEEPEDIIQQIITGFEKDNYTVVIDREQAIRSALKMAQKGDVVLIAGKGHENYQIFKDKTIRFDEKQIVREALLCLK